MLRIRTIESADRITFRLEGRLVGAWVKELAFLWNSVVGVEQRSIQVDLSAVSYVDIPGLELLILMSRRGANVFAAASLNESLAEEIMTAAKA
jgi:hypothetical protein